MKLRRILSITVVLLVAAGIVAAVVWFPSTPVNPRVASVLSQLNASYVGKQAQNIELAAPGSPVMRRLDEYRGDWVFLNFWASWCEPCREEMPSMRTLAQRLSDRNFSMVAVSLDTDLTAMRQFLTEVGVNGRFMDILHDPEGGSARLYGTELLPETWLIAPDGEIVARFQGDYDWTQPEILTLFDLLTREGWQG
jgi:thiol-disulfide isomerase/thioredoxin